MVRAGASGENKGLAKVAEAIIAKVRAKQRNILADRLFQALHCNKEYRHAGFWRPSPQAVTGICLQVPPRTRLEDHTLPLPANRPARS